MSRAHRTGGKDLLDPRQRQAAALLLIAIDLPAEAVAWARQAGQAARVCPGIKCDQAMLGDRRALLRRARALIDAMLAEIG